MTGMECIKTAGNENFFCHDADSFCFSINFYLY